MRCHSDVARRHPGKGQLSVAKGCANGVVGNQCQKELLGVCINILPILQAEADIIESRTTKWGPREGRRREKEGAQDPLGGRDTNHGIKANHQAQRK